MVGDRDIDKDRVFCHTPPVDPGYLYTCAPYDVLQRVDNNRIVHEVQGKSS